VVAVVGDGRGEDRGADGVVRPAALDSGLRGVTETFSVALSGLLAVDGTVGALAWGALAAATLAEKKEAVKSSGV
jgi:hypothetical protein